MLKVAKNIFNMAVSGDLEFPKISHGFITSKYAKCLSKYLEIYRKIKTKSKSPLFRHFLAAFFLYREQCDLHKVDCACIRTLIYRSCFEN